MKVAGICSALFLTTLLSACDNAKTGVPVVPKAETTPGAAQPVVAPKKPAAAEPATILLSIPALPIIQNSVKTLVPALNAEFDLAAVQKVCFLAREEASKEQIAVLLKREGVDVSKIPQQGAPLSLLVNDDQKGRQTLCAAWVATSLLDPLNTSDITEQQTREVKEKNKIRKIAVDVISNGKLQPSLATKTAIARANAEFYGLIASGLASHPGQSLESYSSTIKKQFSVLAPAYLKRVQELYSPSDKGYQLTSLNNGSYSFTTDGGYHFAYDRDGVLLTYNGINWLGKGQIMGKQYDVNVNYFSPQINAALDASTPKN